MPKTALMPLALPLVISSNQLEAHCWHDRLVIVDIPLQAERYNCGHIPGARRLDFMQLLSGQLPTPTAAPDDLTIAAFLSHLGITPDTHVVAYDDEGGGWASRLLWTLALVGHKHYSLLDGGLHGWLADRKPIETTPPPPPAPCQYNIHQRDVTVATHADELLLAPEKYTIWDARSVEEYRGEIGETPRLGHMPGAINLDWRNLFDPENAYRLRPANELRCLLTQHGLTPDRHIVAHCQSHHRSSLAWLVGQYLSYPHLSAYPEAWLEWGTRTDTPITQ